MASTSPSEQAQKYAFSELTRVGDLQKLAAPLRTVVIVVSAQGVIDNGGLQYFFENDFPEQPDYSIFVDAYRAIGADSAANALAAAVALFPFSDPQNHFTQRREFLDRFLDEGPFQQHTEVFWDGRIWKLLDDFVQHNSDAFALPL